MADDIQVTEGSGKAVATDEVSSRHYQVVKIGIGADGEVMLLDSGQAAMAFSIPVVIAGDQSTLPVNQLTSGHDVGVTLTRPNDTTAYAAGDVVGDTTNGGRMLFTAAGKTGGGSTLIVGVQLEVDVTTPPASAFRLHLYSSNPASALADNAAFDVPGGDRSAYLGYVDIPAPTKIGSIGMSEANNIGKQIKLATANCYGYLQAVAGYTPAAGDVYKVTLHTVEV